MKKRTKNESLECLASTRRRLFVLRGVRQFGKYALVAIAVFSALLSTVAEETEGKARPLPNKVYRRSGSVRPVEFSESDATNAYFFAEALVKEIWEA